MKRIELTANIPFYFVVYQLHLKQFLFSILMKSAVIKQSDMMKEPLARLARWRDQLTDQNQYERRVLKISPK